MYNFIIVKIKNISMRSLKGGQYYIVNFFFSFTTLMVLICAYIYKKKKIKFKTKKINKKKRHENFMQFFFTSSVYTELRIVKDHYCSGLEYLLFR